MREEIDNILYSTLFDFWGYTAFRENQREIIFSILGGKDTIALLPTGGGKSLCYQLPAIISNGVCLVVSPLIALMSDQVSDLKKRGIGAAFLSSTLDEFEEEQIYYSCKEGFVKLLYISPERLQNRRFLHHIQEIEISFIAVDEAHCISEWGQDFRPSYQYIRGFREEYKKVPFLALTATATPFVIKEISSKLNLSFPELFKKSYERNNLFIGIDKISDKYQEIYNFLNVHKVSGLIYTRSRKDAEELCSFLKKGGIENVDYYHAGLSSDEKEKKQKRWTESNCYTLICTNAFGMGIDKDNVRFVIHFSPPISIENYYQEIGRAGRDGENSYASMLWNDTELSQYDQIFYNQIPKKSEFLRIVKCLYSIFHITEYDLPDSRMFSVLLSQIKDITSCSLSKVKNVIQFLHHQEIIYYRSCKSQSVLELLIHACDIEVLSKNDGYFLELLLRNLTGMASGRRVQFNEKKLSQKLGTSQEYLRERLREMDNKKYISYTDGNEVSVNFLQSRDDRTMAGRYWSLFEKIQRNRIQKWEEMKYFLTTNKVCKMKMILAYFGERGGNCNRCVVCNAKGGKILQKEIVDVLRKKPSTFDEISVRLVFYKKEIIFEKLVKLLNEDRIKMLDHRTYILNETT